MKTQNRGGLPVVFLLGAVLAGTVLAGCSHPDAPTSALGPAPTAPPAGSPYATGAASASGLTPAAFVSQLQSLPHDQRPAFMQQNQPVMAQIMAGPDSPTKQKLTALINQH